MATMPALGFISGVLGIVSFFQDNFPTKPPEGSVVRIKAGIAQGDEDVSIEGEISAVFGWDVNHNYKGKAKGGYIDEGGIRDFILSQFGSGKRIEYAAVAAEEDAICIAWITVQMHDGTTGGAWTGDIGSECGQAWYPSAERAGKLKDGKQDYIPRCTWLDGDRSGDATVAAMKFATGAYGVDVAETIENKKQCDFTKWGPDIGPIAGRPSKRFVKPRREWMEKRLVVSNISQHKAADVCNSATSWGPDFVGSDGLFCDMNTKILIPICSFHDIDGCIDVNLDNQTITKRSNVAKRRIETRYKTYGTVSQWS
ncbi:hypothetical protein V8C42DRAFT_360011 [Trichoderma barbatum]